MIHRQLFFGKTLSTVITNPFAQLLLPPLGSPHLTGLGSLFFNVLRRSGLKKDIHGGLLPQTMTRCIYFFEINRKLQKTKKPALDLKKSWRWPPDPLLTLQEEA